MASSLRSSFGPLTARPTSEESLVVDKMEKRNGRVDWAPGGEMSRFLRFYVIVYTIRADFLIIVGTVCCRASFK